MDQSSFSWELYVKDGDVLILFLLGLSCCRLILRSSLSTSLFISLDGYSKFRNTLYVIFYIIYNIS